MQRPYGFFFGATPEYQIGEVQARSWIVAGTISDGGRPRATASYVDQRGVGISSTLA